MTESKRLDVKVAAFLFELLDPDVYGQLCAPEVRDEARRLLGLPPQDALCADVATADNL
jgi:hypothetical protein